MSAGLCDNCIVPKIKNDGDGVHQPLDPYLFCDKMNIEIMPLPPDERIVECIFYREEKK